MKSCVILPLANSLLWCMQNLCDDINASFPKLTKYLFLLIYPMPVWPMCWLCYRTSCGVSFQNQFSLLFYWLLLWPLLFPANFRLQFCSSFSSSWVKNIIRLQNSKTPKFSGNLLSSIYTFMVSFTITSNYFLILFFFFCPWVILELYYFNTWEFPEAILLFIYNLILLWSWITVF